MSQPKDRSSSPNPEKTAYTAQGKFPDIIKQKKNRYQQSFEAGKAEEIKKKKTSSVRVICALW